MSHPILEQTVIEQEPEVYLRSEGSVFAVFGQATQDSGNISYGVQFGTERYCIKTAGDPEHISSLTYAERVELLRNAIHLHSTLRHPILAPLLHVIESPHGPLLVYPWADGELLAVQRDRRNQPDSSYYRFRHLPVLEICRCLDAIYELHAALATAGWVAEDFYDGCLIYNFATVQLTIIDLDTYHGGPFRNERGRTFGSSRFMAPEEFERGALIDQQTNVFTMGRTALVFLSDGTLAASAFRGAPALFEVVRRACQSDRAERFESMAAFFQAWQTARLL